MLKKVLTTLFILGVIVALYFGLVKNKQKNSTLPVKQPDKQTETKVEPKTTYLESEQLPAKFPEDFPIEKNVQLIGNYNFENDMQYQATRKFVTKKTLKDNYNIYLNYLTKNGWQIIVNINQDKQKLLSANLGNQSVSVNISPYDSVSNVVDISFVFKK